MPITKDELGLTQAKYDSLLAAYEKGTYRFIAHRANLVFNYSDEGLLEIETDDWAAVYAPEYDYVIYIVDGTVYVHALSPGTFAAPAPFPIPNYSNQARRISATWEGGQLVLFYMLNGGIHGTRRILMYPHQVLLLPALRQTSQPPISHRLFTRLSISFIPAKRASTTL